MSNKGFPLFSALVMIIAMSGCDNVEWAGAHVELRPPPERAPVPERGPADPAEPVLEPLDLGPVLYLVERRGRSEASVIPIAELSAREYRPLPGAEDVPDVVERFPLERWDPGTEFVLLAHGARVGTLTIDGSASRDTNTCELRPASRGRLELLPEASARQTFVAMRKEDLPDPLAPGGYPDIQDTPQVRAGTLNVARLLIPQVQAPWPPSIPEIRRHHAPFPLGDGSTGLAASFIYDGALEVGPAPPLAYSLFYLAREEGGTFRPFASWYQRVRESGKAFPRLLAAHDVHGTGDPDVLLETFGEEDRWLTVLGLRDGSWGIVYQDPCGLQVPSGAIRTYP